MDTISEKALVQQRYSHHGLWRIVLGSKLLWDDIHSNKTWKRDGDNCQEI